MASLEKRYDGRYRIVFCWQGERRYHSLGKMPEREARSCLDRLEESLRFVDRGLLEVPPDADLGRFLVSGGKLNGKPVLETPLRFGELLKRYQAEHPAGVKEASTRSTETIHIAHLLRLIDPKTAVRSITTETLQGYVNARAKEKGRSGRTISHVTIQKEIGTLSSLWNRWARPLGLVVGPAPSKGLIYAKARAKPPFQTREQIERQVARGGFSAAEAKELWGSLFLTLSQVHELLYLDHTQVRQALGLCRVLPGRVHRRRGGRKSCVHASMISTSRPDDHHSREEARSFTEMTFRTVPMADVLKARSGPG